MFNKGLLLYNKDEETRKQVLRKKYYNLTEESKEKAKNKCQIQITYKKGKYDRRRIKGKNE